MPDEREKLAPQDYDLLRAYAAVFRNPAGERVLKHLEHLAGVRHTITPEEQAGAPVDPVRLQINEGMRRLYWRVIATLEAADRLREE